VPEGATIDPDFRSRTPNPADDGNLAALCKRVVAEGADVGIAFDGDGDRVAFVDHTGRIARPEQIGAMIAGQCFDRPVVVYDQKCASVLPKAVLAVGGEPVMQPSGYGFIRSTMIDREADFGVEVSGHYFFKALRGGDDGLYAALVLLEVLAHDTRPLADLISAVGWPAITPDLRIPFAGDANAVLERIAAGCGGQVSRLDGIRAEYDDGWGMARASITEPAMTLRFEGRDRECVKVIAARFLAGAPELLAPVMEKIHE
jgi:phosphomannomutase/phosphoglucomutase